MSSWAANKRSSYIAHPTPSSFHPPRPKGKCKARVKKQNRKMNHCAIQHKHAFSACEEMRSTVVSGAPVSDRRDPVVCPKPRRVGVLISAFNEPRRWLLSHQAEISDSKAGMDLLDIILSKGGNYGSEQSNMHQQVASSPPFFSGSPPSRVANPLIHDARFMDEKITPISPLHQTTAPKFGHSSSPSTKSIRKGGCVRASFGNNPTVRVEGFECSIPALG